MAPSPRSSEALGADGMAAQVVGAPRVPWWRRRAVREELEGWLFISPWVIGFLVLSAGPYLASLALAFMRWDMGQEITFVGLRNFQVMLEDELFARSLLNTLYYTVFHVPGVIVLAFAVAGLLNLKLRAVAVYRTLFYLPSITSGVGTAIIWIWLLAPRGVINTVLGLVGLPGPNWLISTQWAMPALILMSLWNIGSTMVLFLAGLQGVPQHLYDAAAVDGATWWQLTWHVTVPMMTPYIFLAIVLNVIGSFQVFTQALIMTAGGPDNATLFIFLHIYNNAWQYFRMGYASAMALVLMLIILALTIVQFVISRRWVYYEYGAD
jgi:multiple sugar transport system permease protein